MSQIPTRISKDCVLLADWSHHQPTNALKKELAAHVISICEDFRLGIDTPAMLEDQINEWLAPKGALYKRCSTKQVVLVTRPMYDSPTLRVYWESSQHDLYLLVAIAFPLLR